MLLVLLLALHYMCHTQHAPDAWPAATDQHGEGPGLRMHPVLGSGRETFLLCCLQLRLLAASKPPQRQPNRAPDERRWPAPPLRIPLRGRAAAGSTRRRHRIARHSTRGRRPRRPAKSPFASCSRAAVVAAPPRRLRRLSTDEMSSATTSDRTRPSPSLWTPSPPPAIPPPPATPAAAVPPPAPPPFPSESETF